MSLLGLHLITAISIASVIILWYGSREWHILATFSALPAGGLFLASLSTIPGLASQGLWLFVVMGAVILWALYRADNAYWRRHPEWKVRRKES